MMDSFFFGGGFEIVFFLIFGVIAVMILVTLFRGLSQWNKNNHSPRLTVEARVVTKRQNISHHHSGDHMSTTSSRYYVTFQVESGDRMELQMTGPEYGMLAEGDRGRLTFQGTRYVSFEREQGGKQYGNGSVQSLRENIRLREKRLLPVLRRV